MRLRRSELSASAVKKAQYPTEPLPQIALLGRSNAAKSSLINVLIERKNLARTSSAPGKTRLINFYRIDALAEDGAPLLWHFVDLPGYGYAKAAKKERAAWLGFIGEYLRSDAPRMCWQLVDIRHEPSREDIVMHEALLEQGWPVLLIANKIDKVSRNQRQKSLSLISRAMGVDSREIVCFSAVTREGKEELQGIIQSWVLARK